MTSDFFRHPISPPLDDSPTFRQGRFRRTRAGIACYFCGSAFDEDGAYAPCCLAADECNQILRKEQASRILRQLWRAP